MTKEEFERLLEEEGDGHSLEWRDRRSLADVVEVEE
jgi:hypothetical protein